MTETRDMSFEECNAKCQSWGLLLQKPRGLRKYYYLARGHVRFRLGKSWEEARLWLGAALKWLFENYSPGFPSEHKGNDANCV